MTVHRNRFLVNKTNRCTEFQFYWYYISAHRTSYIGFGIFYAVVLTVCYQEQDGTAVPSCSWQLTVITTVQNVPKPMYG